MYSDYLICAFGQTTATGLSSLLDGKVSHDQMRRSLAGEEQTSADLWRIAEPHVRQIESAEGVANVDNSIAEKPYTFKLLKGDTKLNHMILKSKLYLRAIHSAFAALRELNPVQLTA